MEEPHQMAARRENKKRTRDDAGILLLAPSTEEGRRSTDVLLTGKEDVQEHHHVALSTLRVGTSPSGQQQLQMPPPPDRSPPIEAMGGSLQQLGSSGVHATRTRVDAASSKTSICSGNTTYCTSVGAATGETAATNTTSSTVEALRSTVTGEVDRDDKAGGSGLKHTHVGKVTDESLRHFYDAMSLIEADKKEGWTRAQTSCPPAVLRHECCPCYFLLACQFNPWEAASRMCLYWKERISLFQERAFEAMTIGSDAVPPTGLTRDDVQLLETGTFLALPKERCGKSVLFVDEERMEPRMQDHATSRLRVLWYILHTFFMSGGDQAHRLVVLYACYRPPSGGQYGTSTWQFSSGSVKFPLVLPIVMDSIHLLTLQTKTGTRTLIHVILSAAAAMVGSYLSSLTKVHHGTVKRGNFTNPLEEEARAKDALRQKMMDIGFTSKGLPDWAGGSFGSQDFVSWAKRRRRYEQRMFWTTEQRMLQRRDVNKVHSQRKRRRRHEELHELQSQVSRLTDENQRARRLHTTLENLIATATIFIAQLESLPPTSVNPTVDWMCDPRPIPEDSADSFDRLAFMASLEPDPIAPLCAPVAGAAGATYLPPITFGPSLLDASVNSCMSRFSGPNDGAAPCDLGRLSQTVNFLTTSDTPWQIQTSTPLGATPFATLDSSAFDLRLQPTPPVGNCAVSMRSGMLSASSHSDHGALLPVTTSTNEPQELATLVDTTCPNPALAFHFGAMLHNQQQLPHSSVFAPATLSTPTGRLDASLDELLPASIDSLNAPSMNLPSFGSDQGHGGDGRIDATASFDLDWT